MIQSPYSELPLILTLQEATFLCPGYPIAQSLPKSFKRSSPKSAQLAYPALPIPSCKNHDQGSCSCFPLAPSVSRLILVLPSPLHLRTVSKKRSFQQQFSPDLLASPSLNKNKIPGTFSNNIWNTMRWWLRPWTLIPGFKFQHLCFLGMWTSYLVSYLLAPRHNFLICKMGR